MVELSAIAQTKLTIAAMWMSSDDQTKLKNIMKNMDPDVRDKVTDAINKDPDGLIKKMQEKQKADPALLDKVSKDPNSLAQVMGVDAGHAPQQQTVQNNTTPPAPDNTSNNTQSSTPPAPTPDSPALSDDAKAQIGQFMLDNPDLAAKLNAMSPDTQKKLTEALTKEVTKNPDFLKDVSKFVKDHPQMVNTMVTQLEQDPDGAIKNFENMQSMDKMKNGLVDMLGGPNSEVGGFINKLFASLENSPLGPMLAGLFGKFTDSAHDATNAANTNSNANNSTTTPTSVNNDQNTQLLALLNTTGAGGSVTVKNSDGSTKTVTSTAPTTPAPQQQQQPSNTPPTPAPT